MDYHLLRSFTLAMHVPPHDKTLENHITFPKESENTTLSTCEHCCLNRECAKYTIYYFHCIETSHRPRFKSKLSQTRQKKQANKHIRIVPSKDKWKRTVQAAVNRYWNSVLLEDCIGKSTISRCNYNNLSIGKQHIVLKYLDCNTHDVRRGVVKVRLLTGTYLVQSKISRFNQYQVDPTCMLCRSSPEDYMHMILDFGALLKYRKDYIHKLELLFLNGTNRSAGPTVTYKLALYM